MNKRQMNRLEWIDKFYADGALKSVSEEQIELLEENAPLYLYQYRAGNEYDLLNISNGTIWGSAVDRFNDPFDCDFSSRPMRDICEKIKDKYKSEKSKELLNEYTNSILELKWSAAISCFSEKRDSLLMWSHYADGHRGICVCYNMFDLSGAKKILCPVWYRNEKVNAYTYGDDGKLRINERIKEIYVQKSLEWSYEEEWRMIEFDEKEVQNIRNNKGKVIGNVFPRTIYIGAKAREELIESIMEIARRLKIDVYQMQLNEESYTLKEKIILNSFEGY